MFTFFLPFLKFLLGTEHLWMFQCFNRSRQMVSMIIMQHCKQIICHPFLTAFEHPSHGNPTKNRSVVEMNLSCHKSYSHYKPTLHDLTEAQFCFQKNCRANVERRERNEKKIVWERKMLISSQQSSFLPPASVVNHQRYNEGQCLFWREKWEEKEWAHTLATAQWPCGNVSVTVKRSKD